MKRSSWSLLSATVLVAALSSAPVHADATVPVPKSSRHALIVGVGHYARQEIPTLEGVRFDMEHARKMARAMSIPDENIVYLRDTEATAQNIRAAIDDLDQRTFPGDRVFIYYSGHGTRWYETRDNLNRCVEGLLPADGLPLSNQELGVMLKRLAAKTDKLMVFYDACFSGGVATAPFQTRSITVGANKLTPKFTPVGAAEVCAKPTNFTTRSLSLVMREQGGLPENVVHVAAARPDEVSFDNPEGGGFATVAWRDCLLGGAKDIDGSGAITVDEITQCAQKSLDKSLADRPGITGQHMTIGGNRSFVPNSIAAAFQSTDSKPSSSGSVSPVVAPAQLLQEVHQQRDGSRELDVKLASSSLKIGRDKLEMSITPTQDGFLYLLLAGSDQKSLYLLYPNALSAGNAVKAGQTIRLPTRDWELAAGGPPGDDVLLAMVTDSQRDISGLGAEKTGPFVKTLLDTDGRSRLQSILSNSANGGLDKCQQAGGVRNLLVAKACSDGFGSALLTIREEE